MDIEELARLLQNLIRIGNISAVRHEHPPRVRVKSGNLETDWRPWWELRAGKSKSWNPPTVGEQAIILSPGGDPAAAMILVGLNSDANQAPSSDPNQTVYEYPDGAVQTYDHASGAMVISGIKTLLVQAAENITLDAPHIILDADQTTSTGKHTIEGLLSYMAGMAGENGAGGTTTITGDITHQGGNLSSNGVVVHLHIHGGVQRGSANTDKPSS